jgi:hypothetical protein
MTRAPEVIAGVLQNGYLCAAAFDTDPWLIPLVSIPGGKDPLERARSPSRCGASPSPGCGCEP